MSVTSMIRNGYKLVAGQFVKLVQFENVTSGNNHYVERITRDSSGRIVKVERANK